MDFGDEHAHYERLNSRWLPRFGLAYLTEQQLGARESGQVHSQVQYRWRQGDAEVRRAVREIARCAEAGREALRHRDMRRLGKLMDRNFDLRRGLFGDEALGQHNITMVEIARRAGLPAKLPGSSGTVLVLPQDAVSERAVGAAYKDAGYHYVSVRAV
jgi:glucuronokinase